MKVVGLNGEFVVIDDFTDTGRKDKDGKLILLAKELGCPRQGTLNGDPINRSELLPGDVIMIGHSHFTATRKPESISEAVKRGFKSK